MYWMDWLYKQDPGAAKTTKARGISLCSSAQIEGVGGCRPLPRTGQNNHLNTLSSLDTWVSHTRFLCLKKEKEKTCEMSNLFSLGKQCPIRYAASLLFHGAVFSYLFALNTKSFIFVIVSWLFISLQSWGKNPLSFISNPILLTSLVEFYKIITSNTVLRSLLWNNLSI